MSKLFIKSFMVKEEGTNNKFTLYTSILNATEGVSLTLTSENDNIVVVDEKSILSNSYSILVTDECIETQEKNTIIEMFPALEGMSSIDIQIAQEDPQESLIVYSFQNGTAESLIARLNNETLELDFTDAGILLG